MEMLSGCSTLKVATELGWTESHASKRCLLIGANLGMGFVLHDVLLMQFKYNTVCGASAKKIQVRSKS